MKCLTENAVPPLVQAKRRTWAEAQLILRSSRKSRASTILSRVDRHMAS